MAIVRLSKKVIRFPQPKKTVKRLYPLHRLLSAVNSVSFHAGFQSASIFG
jgi:hypothetical protein